jgi:hypothetical protein
VVGRNTGPTVDNHLDVTYDDYRYERLVAISLTSNATTASGFNEVIELDCLTSQSAGLAPRDECQMVNGDGTCCGYRDGSVSLSRNWDDSDGAFRQGKISQSQWTPTVRLRL